MSEPFRTAAADGPPAVPAKIVDAARHVLARYGLAAATLQRISAEAGMSRMTLHRRGVSKQDILRAVADDYEADHRQAMWTALISDGTAQQRLRRALTLQCEVTERNLATLEALSPATHDAIFHEPGAEALTRATFLAPLQRLLLDGAADGSLARVDAQETATVLFNAVSHTYRHLRTGHRWSPQRARGAVIALLVEGLVAR